VKRWHREHDDRSQLREENECREKHDAAFKVFTTLHDLSLVPETLMFTAGEQGVRSSFRLDAFLR
jgi:hypothetical protein